MDFEQRLENWLIEGLDSDIPGEVRAFSFNLFEPASKEDVKFGIELVGVSEFDPNGEDWACDEVWEPKRRQLLIPSAVSGQSWETCLEIMKKSINSLLDSGCSFAEALKSREGIGIGFVDGNLEIIWQR